MKDLREGARTGSWPAGHSVEGVAMDRGRAEIPRALRAVKDRDTEFAGRISSVASQKLQNDNRFLSSPEFVLTTG
jgi:hypothetical protein